MAKDIKTSKENGIDEKPDLRMDRFRSGLRKVCNAKHLYKKVPILEWLPKYDLEKGVADLIAGITVGLTVIPQGIAYALVAKLPPQVYTVECFPRF